jgi:hypothetical protein
MAMQVLTITRGVHVGDAKVFLLVHKHHMTLQIPSHSSKTMATNNLKKLVPWSY